MTRAAKPEPAEPARQTLRDLSKVCGSHSPEALAGVATDVSGTLATVAKIEIWFKRYRAALRRRQPQ